MQKEQTRREKGGGREGTNGRKKSNEIFTLVGDKWMFERMAEKWFHGEHKLLGISRASWKTKAWIKDRENVTQEDKNRNSYPTNHVVSVNGAWILIQGAP